MKSETKIIFDELFERYPALTICRNDVSRAFDTLLGTYQNGGKTMICGNGGSASDAEHIVGELLKKFKKHRDIDPALKSALLDAGEDGAYLAEKLEGSLPAISLISMTAIVSAFANDVNWDAAFAQQLLGLAKRGDTLIAISTGGNSRDCVLAATLARQIGVKSIALTGERESKLSRLCDVTIRVPSCETYKVQEFHLPVYHALCAMLESELF